jgi:D-alanyl-D-alanine carboxypeptidase
VAGLALAVHAPAAHAAGKSAVLVIDANTGRVLHASAADEPRHPASLAKMMTLYIAFERLAQGRLTYQTKIRISANAAAAAPTKLDLAEGEEVALIDAMKALITKSANDMAVAIAEHIAGSEEKFARLMTAKAHQLGMAATVFRNASGLPDDEQVTTARDMVTLALRLQDDFPQHYPLFATRTFTYNGETLHNHNALLDTFEGTDGIKTGYTRASGFNLVASVHRGRKHVVGAIFGGASAAARDAAMRTFLNIGLVKASSVKSRQPAPLRVALARPEPASQIGPVPAPRRAEPPAVKPTNAAPPAEPAAVPQTQAHRSPAIEIARVRAVLVAPRSDHPTTASPPRQPTPVGVAEVLARADVSRGTPADPAAGAPSPPQPKWTTASVDNLPMRATAPGDKPAFLSGAASAPEVRLGAAPSTLGQQAAHLARGAPPVAATPAAAAGPFQIQIGAYQSLAEAEKRLAWARELAPSLLGNRSPVTRTVKQGDKVFYRARYAGFEAKAAASACGELKRLKIDCLVLRAD